MVVDLLDAGIPEAGSNSSGEGTSSGLGFNAGCDADAFVNGVVREDGGVADAPGDNLSAGGVFSTGGNGEALCGGYVLDEGAFLAGQHKTGEGTTDGIVGHSVSLVWGCSEQETTGRWTELDVLCPLQRYCVASCPRP
jgi:hypothetical protein